MHVQTMASGTGASDQSQGSPMRQEATTAQRSHETPRRKQRTRATMQRSHNDRAHAQAMMKLSSAGRRGDLHRWLAVDHSRYFTSGTRLQAPQRSVQRLENMRLRAVVRSSTARRAQRGKVDQRGTGRGPVSRQSARDTSARRRCIERRQRAPRWLSMMCTSICHYASNRRRFCTPLPGPSCRNRCTIGSSCS